MVCGPSCLVSRHFVDLAVMPFHIAMKHEDVPKEGGRGAPPPPLGACGATGRGLQARGVKTRWSPLSLRPKNGF